jgi:hypothetical protein
VKNGSMTRVSAELVKIAVFSSSRTRATGRRRARPEVGHRQGQQVMEQARAELRRRCGWWYARTDSSQYAENSLEHRIFQDQ